MPGQPQSPPPAPHVPAPSPSRAHPPLTLSGQPWGQLHLVFMQRQVMGSQHANPKSRSQSLVQEVPDQLFILEIGDL